MLKKGLIISILTIGILFNFLNGKALADTNSSQYSLNYSEEELVKEEPEKVETSNRNSTSYRYSISLNDINPNNVHEDPGPPRYFYLNPVFIACVFILFLILVIVFIVVRKGRDKKAKE